MCKFVTPEGFKKLKKELEELKNIKRSEITKRLQKTSSFGDLTENAEYLEAKEAQAMVEGRILELERLMREVVLTKKSKNKNRVQIGSTIKVASFSLKRKQIFTFTVVGAEETSPEKGRISADSPLGKAFLNKPLGTLVEVEPPLGKKKKYKIIKII